MSNNNEKLNTVFAHQPKTDAASKSASGAASVRAIGDIQFCSDFLMCQLNQAIATARARCWLT